MMFRWVIQRLNSMQACDITMTTYLTLWNVRVKSFFANPLFHQAATYLLLYSFAILLSFLFTGGGKATDIERGIEAG